jgi:HK97 gp10 family phage protein
MSDGIDLKITNLKAFNKKLQATLDDNKVKEYVTRGTLMVQNTAKQSIMAGGTGETYQKYEPRRTHTASAPNQPPASDTGFLVSQITMDVDVKANGTVVGQIISAAPYSKHLEFGTVNMTERPFMQPALMKNKRKIQAMFKKGILK